MSEQYMNTPCWAARRGRYLLATYHFYLLGVNEQAACGYSEITDSRYRAVAPDFSLSAVMRCNRCYMKVLEDAEKFIYTTQKDLSTWMESLADENWALESRPRQTLFVDDEVTLRAVIAVERLARYKLLRTLKSNIMRSPEDGV